MNIEKLNDFSKIIHQQNVRAGWWDDPDRCVFQTLQLINTEIAEATEADRKDLRDRCIPPRKGVEVELADTLIRVLDLGGRYGWELVAPLFSHRLELETSKYCSNLAAAHFWITATVIELGAYILVSKETGVPLRVSESCQKVYTILVASILYVADKEGYDLGGAMCEKLAHNLHRIDHTKTARASKHGKKY